MIDKDVIDKLRERYSFLHPLLFQRSVERAKSPGDLFDILDTVPNEYPLIWDEDQRKWVTTKDLFQAASFVKKTTGED